MRHYELAVKNDSSNASHLYNRGLVKSRLDKTEEAIQDYKKALESLSGNLDNDTKYQCEFNLGVCLRR